MVLLTKILLICIWHNMIQSDKHYSAYQNIAMHEVLKGFNTFSVCKLLLVTQWTIHTSSASHSAMNAIEICQNESLPQFIVSFSPPHFGCSAAWQLVLDLGNICQLVYWDLSAIATCLRSTLYCRGSDSDWLHMGGPHQSAKWVNTPQVRIWKHNSSNHT